MQVLQAYDQLLPWTPLLRTLFAQFESDPYAIVRWMTAAGPREYASLAPLIVTHADRDDTAARNLMRAAGAHIDQLVAKVAATGSSRVALLGGLSASIEPYLVNSARILLVAARGDAMSGALRLARRLKAGQTVKLTLATADAAGGQQKLPLSVRAAR